MAETFLITGANGGIGLAVTTQLLNQGDRVFATCRQPQTSTELLALKEQYPEQLELISLDVTSDESVRAAFSQVLPRTEWIDVLVNMAGILPQPFITPLERLDFDHCRLAFETNALGSLRVSRTFLPLLRNSKYPRVVNISSISGSLSKALQITANAENEGQMYAYGTSKTALNMLTRYLAAEFKPAGIICVAMNPGWVKTRMGGENALLTTDESAAAIAQTIKNLTMEQSSLFIDNGGKRLEW